MKYITLSADEMALEAARQRAAAENSTLDDQFRRWLNSYAGPEMLERVQKSWDRSHNFGLYDDPVDYAILEKHLEELDLSPAYGESMEERYRRQGDEWLRSREFERDNQERLEGLSGLERYLLFLKEEGRHDREQRRRYLLFLRYERQQAEAANWLADAGGTEPQIEDIPRRRSGEYAEHLAGQRRRQGEGMMKFLEFEQGLDENQQKLTQRERYLLFLEHESRLSEEGRQHYLRFLRHERPYLAQYNLDALNITLPNDYDSD